MTRACHYKREYSISIGWSRPEYCITVHHTPTHAPPAQTGWIQNYVNILTLRLSSISTLALSSHFHIHSDLISSPNDVFSMLSASPQPHWQQLHSLTYVQSFASRARELLEMSWPGVWWWWLCAGLEWLPISARSKVTSPSYLWLVVWGRSMRGHNVFMILQFQFRLSQTIKSNQSNNTQHPALAGFKAFYYFQWRHSSLLRERLKGGK